MLITVIRVHGKLDELVDTENPSKTVIKTDNGDEKINAIIKKYPDAVLNAETFYNPTTGLLADIFYIQVEIDSDGSSYDGDDDDFGDDDDGGGDGDGGGLVEMFKGPSPWIAISGGVGTHDN